MLKNMLLNEEKVFFERILEEHIRGLINATMVPPSQHAYLQGKSMETVFQEVLRCIDL